MKVWLDVGHGRGNRKPGVFDPGASCWFRLIKRLEHGAALWTVNRVARRLRAKNIDVFITKDGHYTKRAARAHEAGCRYGISVHFNGGTKTATGTETFIHPQAGALSHKLQDNLHPRLVKATTLRDRGRKAYGWAVCSGPIACCLIEVAFMNPHDFRVWLARRWNVVDAIVAAVLRTR